MLVGSAEDLEQFRRGPERPLDPIGSAVEQKPYGLAVSLRVWGLRQDCRLRSIEARTRALCGRGFFHREHEM